MKQLAAIGLGSRGRSYLENLTKYEDIEVTALCDLNPAMLEAARNDFSQNAACYAQEEAFWQAGKLADWIVIATMDNDHYRHIMTALELGYHIMVEKPVTANPAEMDDILAKAKEKDRQVIVGHVLRYAPFFVKIKEILDSGVLGDIVTINHEEGVSYWLYSHGYVRGNWKNTRVGTPLLLAKNCHDFDLIYWFIGQDCTRVNSFGGLRLFNAENAPAGATDFCFGGCKAKGECVYDAERCYLNPQYLPVGMDSDEMTEEYLHGMLHYWLWPLITGKPGVSREEVREALKTSDYGRCVYHSDNDINDHQTVSMLFEGGTTANFTVSAFTKNFTRRIRITGTKGEIYGTDDEQTLTMNIFGEESKTFKIELPEDLVDGHGGGDHGICETLHQIMRGEEVDQNRLTTIDVTAKSHRIAYAALESEKTGASVSMK